MKKVFLVGTVLIGLTIAAATSCSEPPSQKIEKKDPSPCAAYFEFDSVEYYTIDIGDTEVWALDSAERKSASKARLSQVLTQYDPTTLADSGTVMNLRTIGFIDRAVPSKHFDGLRRIFCEREHADPVFTACVAIWRDILLFRRNGRIVGIAKLCFDCDRSIIIGTEKNTENFGQSGDFGELARILMSPGDS